MEVFVLGLGLFRVMAVFVLAVLVWEPPAQVLSNSVPAKVSSASAALELAPEIAEKRIPVAIKGVVTCSDAGSSLFFVQDSTAGIYIYTVQALPPIGSLVEVTGATGKGLFSPIVMADGIKNLG